MMKKIFFLMLCIICIQNITAQQIRMDWAEPNTNNFVQNKIELCGVSKTIDIRVSHVQGGDPNCPYPGWGANRYKYTVKLYKNGVVFKTQSYQASSCWVNAIFRNVVVGSGAYKATIKLEVRRSFWRWKTQFTSNASSFIEVERNSAEPAFTINGIIPNPEVPIEVCPSKIIIDASGTTCEDKYNIGVWEFDYQNWSRPREYEWGKWFNGQAPTSLNLQQLSATHSFGSNFSGIPSREGEILYGGKLPNGNDRYYYVQVCIGYPSWKCASAVIKVKCDCQ